MLLWRTRLPRGWTMSSETSTSDGFQVSHFFVLLSLLAATVAVVMARPSAPEHLILISLTIGAAGLAALCFYRVLAPLIAPHADLERQPLSERMRADLEREKALTLRSIKELEFDRAMGKLSDGDWQEMSTRLRARASRLMRQLDAGPGYREQIEKDLAKRLGEANARLKPSHYTGDEEPDTRSANGLAERLDTRSAKASAERACTSCATVNDADARFCKGCGGKL
jgi:hypothetical protein